MNFRAYMLNEAKIKLGDVVICPDGEVGYVFNWWPEGARVVRVGVMGTDTGKGEIPEKDLKATGIDIKSPLGDFLIHAKDKKTAKKIVTDKKILKLNKAWKKEGFKYDPERYKKYSAEFKELTKKYVKMYKAS